MAPLLFLRLGPDMNRPLLLLFSCLVFSAAECRAEDWVVGVHTFSIHTPQRDQSNENFGLYVRYGQWVAGAYRNSHDRNTFYAGYEVNLIRAQYVELGLLLGGATGYQSTCAGSECSGFSRGAVAPLGALSLAPRWGFPITPRLTFLPSLGGKTSAVYHFSVETKF